VNTFCGFTRSLLKTDIDGIVRVGNTRVTLDTVIIAFREGATAEEIVSQYSSLLLADVYAVIGYYLQQQPEIEAYLSQREKIANEVRQQNEARFNQQGIRNRLLARQSHRGTMNYASTSG